MPELPEVETIRRALLPRLMHRTIIRVDSFVPSLRYPLSLQQDPSILRKAIIAIHRRAKYLLIELENQRVILLHLGMTGNCRIVPSQQERARHEHVVFTLDNGLSWRVQDPRRFGMLKICRIRERHALPSELDDLGIEPLSMEFTGSYLKSHCHQRLRPIKNLVMDNKILVGVGNIYANESLFHARIHPQTPSGALSDFQAETLVRSIQKILKAAVEAGGSSIIDFKNIDGSEGKFAQKLQVYGKTNRPCPSCRKTTIRRIRLAGRSSFYCPTCQNSPD